MASILRKIIQYRNSKDDVMDVVQSLMRKAERKGELSIEELKRFVSSFIPEDEDRSSYPCSEEAPCRMYLNEVFDYLENRGFI